MAKKIRVLIVDDSDFQRSVIAGILESDPEITVIGQATDGVEAIEKTLQLKPDVITMDIKMPIMDGLSATREIMAERPTPILIVSVTVHEEQKFAFTCLKYGALDFVPVTPGVGIAADELIGKIKMCSKIKVATHLREKEPATAISQPERIAVYEIVAMAASTGGPLALAEILSQLPRNFSVPIVIVQHIANGFIPSLVEWLGDRCEIKIVEAKDKDELKPGVAYLAPNGSHLTIDKTKKIKLLEEDIQEVYHKPSADIMFKSVAGVYGPHAIGIIMTGMGKDGTVGIKAVKEAKGFTIAQDKETSTIFGMGKIAIEEDSIKKVLPLERIASSLMMLVG